MPAKGSAIEKEMQKVVAGLKTNDMRAHATRNVLWRECIHADPIAAYQGIPDPFYTSNFQAFVWDPKTVFGKFFDFDTIKCCKRGCDGKQKNGEYAWRPMIKFDQVIWVLHHRIRCKKCHAGYTSIDPRFISQLPTRVAERFPFFVPLRGPGLHQSMIFQFVNLTTKQILFGTYINSINEILKIKYSQDMVAYYDAEHSRKKFAEHTNATTTSKVCQR